MNVTDGVLVRFRGVRKTYDGVSLVVRHLDLDVHRGEFLTLLGPSGSGKTTTLMMLAGFEAPTEGEITLAERSLAHLPPHKRDIGVVFQNYALFPHMTVAENLGFPLDVRGISKAETATRVARALDMVRLGKLGARRPGQLSGGQQQRVALARALVFEPQLVLMDEPLGALDKQLREEMQLEIRRLHERLGVTIVYVTHDQAEALILSDRIAVFHDGAVQQLDTPDNLYERPRQRLRGALHRREQPAERRGRRARRHVVPDPSAQRPGDPRHARRRRFLEAPATLSIRPERVRLCGSDKQADGYDNRFPARVREIIYLGDHVRVRLALDDATELMAKVPIDSADASLAPDAKILVAWRAGDCRAFAPE